MLTGWRLNVSKMFLIPQRYVLGLMGFLAIVNAYTMRVSLSVAITEMVKPRNSSTIIEETCPENSGAGGVTPAVTDASQLYDWDKPTQGLIMGAFYWGYLLTHLPGGILAEKFGGKYTLGLGILSTALFTLITPAVITQTNGNWKVLVVLRAIEGAGEGTTYPALNFLIAKWIPLSERARIGSLVYAGGQMGTIISNMISGTLIKRTESWASVFYVFGALGIVWFIVWTLICYSEPESHPFITDEEKAYLDKELDNVSHEKKATPWGALLTSVPLWALAAAQVGHDWGFYTMVSDLPKYMKEVLRFDVEANGIWSSMPYLLMWIVSMLGGWLCDFLISRKILGITMARKMFTSIASLGPAVFIIIASYCGCNQILSVSMFTIGMGFMGTFYCGMKVNALDLAPNFAGTIMAIINGIGSIAGIITPYLTEVLTENHSLTEWRTVFWISFGVFNVTNIIYVCFASGEEQWWNNPDRKKDDKDVSLESNSKRGSIHVE